jgi:hypothetical protein
LVFKHRLFRFNKGPFAFTVSKTAGIQAYEVITGLGKGLTKERIASAVVSITIHKVDYAFAVWS